MFPQQTEVVDDRLPFAIGSRSRTSYRVLKVAEESVWFPLSSIASTSY